MPDHPLSISFYKEPVCRNLSREPVKGQYKSTLPIEIVSDTHGT
jgi:hypothetical protein